jgi:hypothetical protein
MNIIFILSSLLFVIVALYVTKQLLSIGKRLTEINLAIAIYFLAATISIGIIAYNLVSELINHFNHATTSTIKNETIVLIGSGLGLALIIVIITQLLSGFIYNILFDNAKEEQVKEFANNNIYMAIIRGGILIGFTLSMIPLIEIVFALFVPNLPIRGGGYN